MTITSVGLKDPLVGVTHLLVYQHASAPSYFIRCTFQGAVEESNRIMSLMPTISRAQYSCCIQASACGASLLLPSHSSSLTLAGKNQDQRNRPSVFKSGANPS